ncbi:MAG TPA: hypothetical protein VNZ22_06870, partial [Bacillota bacterium]|nr:hypothetical protein [Bacillota bacterium]
QAKQWAILLYHKERLCGFSTQVLFDFPHENCLTRILFSGDTIIDKSCWGSLALPVAWGRLMLSLQAAGPDTALYWLLTSKGYKTYRFLPVFFQEFYPCCSAPTPAFEKTLLQHVAGHRFGNRFNPATGVLRAEPGAQRLREGVAGLDERRLRDPHVAFFHHQNPGHAQGDELVCLARCHPENLTPYIRRQL